MALLFSDTQTGITTDAQTGGVKATFETMQAVVDTTTADAGTLDIEVEWSHDGNTWYSFSTPDTFTQITATGQTWKSDLPARAQWLRLSYTVVTGPFDFTVSIIGF